MADETPSRPNELETRLKILRDLDWRVAVHNDYMLNGKLHTFWGFTRYNQYFVKGEGHTDIEALREIFTTLKIEDLCTP